MRKECGLERLHEGGEDPRQTVESSKKKKENKKKKKKKKEKKKKKRNDSELGQGHIFTTPKNSVPFY